MDLRRGLQDEYGRRRSGDGGYGRAIPPRAMPSLSTGQGFYTVESLQGATVVPPPQPAPPPPRLLPPEPYPRDLPPRPSHRFPPPERGNFGGPPPFDRRYPPPPSLGRKMMMPPPDLPLPRRGELMRGPGMMPPPPSFMAEPRMPGFFPGRREPPPRGGWGPSGDFDRQWSDRIRDRDRSRPSQRIRIKKQGQKATKPVSQAKSPSKASAADEKSSADKPNAVEGGSGWCAVCKIDCLKADALKKHVAGKKHKKQLESQMQAENSSDKAEETSDIGKEGQGTTTAAEEAAEKAGESKNNVGDKETVEKEGEIAGKFMENPAIEGVKDGEKSEPNELSSNPATPGAGKKRAVKEGTHPNKKPRKSVASSLTPNATAVNTKNASEALGTDKATVNPQSKSTDQAVNPKKSANNLKPKSELPASGDGLPSVKEDNPQGMEIESKEVRNVMDLENGKAGQSAEIQ